MSPYILLTQADKQIFSSYKKMMDGLAEFLGSGCELVLHSLENLDSSAIKLINGQLSGRSEGEPITDLLLETLYQIKNHQEFKDGFAYKTYSKSGAPIRAATIPVHGENDRIIGLLCINFYMEQPLYSFLEDMLLLPGSDNITVRNIIEDSSNSEELINDQLGKIRKDVYLDNNISAGNKNKVIISKMLERNLFDYKDAVAITAEVLGISKNTVYLHLRNMQKGK